MQEDAILSFLKKHPDFLMQHAHQLDLAVNAKTQGVIPLAERKISRLQAQKKQLEEQLETLQKYARANDKIINALHLCTLGLQHSFSLESFLSQLTDSLALHFGLHRIALRLWHPALHQEHPLHTRHPQILFAAKNLNEPYCGPYVNEEILSWFTSIPTLQSFAQVPLCNQQDEPFGLFVLASDEPERFTLDMNKHYLNQLGEHVAAALLRLLKNPTLSHSAS